MAGNDLKALQRLLDEAMEKMPDKVPKIIQVEGLAFINRNFNNEGFDSGSGTRKWKERKTVDTRGRDITRYRTNKRGRKGSLTKFGRNNQNRAILVGHKSAGNKLKNSIRSRKSKTQVRFFTYKEYANRHNEGLDGMPQRQFMGPSKYLDKRIEKKLTKLLDSCFKK